MKTEEVVYRDNTLWSEAHSPLFLLPKYLKSGSEYFWIVRTKQIFSYYPVCVIDDTLKVFCFFFRDMKKIPSVVHLGRKFI